MSMLLMRRALMGGAPDIALQTILSKDAPAFYLPDPDPALRMPSGLRRGYQDFSNTPVTAATQTAALALDLSEGAAIGAELAVNGGFDVDSDWDKGTGWSIGSGAAAAAAATGFLDTAANVPIVAGRLYRLSFRVFDYVSGGVQPRFTGASPVLGAAVSADGTFDQYIFASTDDEDLSFRPVGAFTGKIDDVSIQEIAGYHFYQSTSADEPTLNLTNGLYGYLGDGASKHFISGLTASATEGTLIIAGVADEANDMFAGTFAGANDYLGLKTASTTGYLGGLVGQTLQNVITGDTDVRGVPIVAALTYDNGTVVLEHWPIATGVKVTDYSGAYAGSPNTTQPIYLLAYNNNGGDAQQLDGSLQRAIYQRSAWTAAEREAVAQQYVRQLAALAA